ncbi:biotin carboxylase N-terminal domain-containing protein, partial [Microbacterium sp. GbtcB4]|uniref:biotin carboxylase N-terminal domain-containing protein n=1 Tax=Microbacterium sp. GbtcB4 TaxID=2824749 RepID=UPI00267104CA
SVHGLRPAEASETAERGPPVRAYLDVGEIIRVATEAGADAIYPGYGFLSGNPELAEKAGADGNVFIGPPAEGLGMA